MELDKRIKSIDDIQTIISNNRGSIGCKGFFFDNFVQAKDLTKTHYGTLVDIDNNDDNDLCFKARDKNGNDFVGYFRLFIPEDALKPAEKKYRPYSLELWTRHYDIGEIIHFRHKDSKVQHRMMLTGYTTEDGTDMTTNGMGTINLGGFLYSFQTLFESYEIMIDDEWQPFGVLDNGDKDKE